MLGIHSHWPRGRRLKVAEPAVASPEDGGTYRLRRHEQTMLDIRILASAFACCPPGKPGFSGGEDVLGWSLLKQIARFHQVWALTQAEDREDIEQALREAPVANLCFCYVDLPHWLRPLMKIQGGHQFYYYLWQIKAYLVARRIMKRHSFDLFHHITYANDWAASFIGALLPIPYVRGPGGGAHRTPRGFESEYPIGGRMWERVRSIGQRLFRLDPFFLRGQSRARAILLCNQESLSQVSAKWAQKVHLFPVSGISSEDLCHSAPPNAAVRPFRVLSAGTLIKIKGFGLAIKAFKEFVGKYPEAEFCIIGSGPEEARLKDMVSRLQLNSKVHLLQAMPRHELLSQMSSCDVFIFPSLRDGGGTVVIEAMAMGSPVICLDTGGPGIHVTNDCGVKISPSSPEKAVHELASALERLYLDRDLRQRMGQAARERAEAFYHWDKLGERLMEIYRIALKDEGNSKVK